MVLHRYNIVFYYDNAIVQWPGEIWCIDYDYIPTNIPIGEHVNYCLG